MAANYGALVADLIQSVRDYYTLPSFDEGSDDRILRTLNREQLGYIQTLLLGASSEYRDDVYSIDVTPNQLAYDIPTRAVASGILYVQATDSGGNKWLTVEVRPSDMPYIVAPLWVAPGGQFYLRRNQIIFYASPPTGTVDITYPMRLSQLVPLGGFGTVGAITGPNTVTFTGSLATGKTDVIDSVPQFDTLAMDQDVTVSGSVATFTHGVPSRLKAGSYLSAADTSPVCQAPLELHPLLCCRTSWSILMAKGDPLAKAAADQQLAEMANDIKSLLEPRPGKPRSNINYSGPGWRRGWYGSYGGMQ